MRYLLVFLFFCSVISCDETQQRIAFTTVSIEPVYEDSLSIRAITFLDSNTLSFAANKGTYGTVDLESGKVRTNVEKYHTLIPEYRAIATNKADFFMLSIGNPALLYKTGDNGKMDLVYMEEGEGVFYDAIAFWNADEGIAVGDTVDGCISITITRDGGFTWTKLDCQQLPKSIGGEGAFAASNTNIEVFGNDTWVATTKRILYSPDKGKTWEAITTPVRTVAESEGIFSIDFHDKNLGIAVGGDFTKPEGNLRNKAITSDGGKTWSLIADGNDPGYKSCIQFVPGGGGKEIVAIGFTGISYSKDSGAQWKTLSEEGFYTLRFLNDTVAYAAGKNRISKLTFK
ncbi:WD40/YVTN/BNR-like repeat-containing protein [Maribacter sp. 2307UL18-2]|uniref:WD40/YVTN/BNR-like repeat-containing protein n=1 Tax=Maribacter sp. 2307UL18-2 TaxID=3386274 RepID=UPI0039BC3C70